MPMCEKFAIKQPRVSCPLTWGEGDLKTVSFEAANAAAQQVPGGDHPLGYSDHRALDARIHY